MRKHIHLPALILVLALGVCLPGCKASIGETDGSQASKILASAEDLAGQIPAVISSLAVVAKDAPVDDATKAQIDKYADAAVAAAQGLSAVGKAPDQAASAFASLASFVQKLPMDAQTASQVSNYAAWAKFGFQVLGAAVKGVSARKSPAVTASIAPPANPIPPGESCSTCHSRVTAAFGFTADRDAWA